MQQHKSIYYLTGMGGRLSEGLGGALTSRGLTVYGRELNGEFQRLGFQEQVDAIAYDLTADHWDEHSRVIANSFGAYLFLHAQAQIPPYIGMILLLSPIVGEFNDDQSMRGFIPPRSTRLRELAESGLYPTPSRCEIHVGSRDWQSSPNAVSRFAKLLGVEISVVDGAGHSLPKTYVSKVVDEWLDS
jgi:hypothetical protein